MIAVISTYSTEKNVGLLDNAMKQGTYIYTKSIHYFQIVEKMNILLFSFGVSCLICM
jgi:hypothetical protein